MGGDGKRAAEGDLAYLGVHQYWIRTDKPTPYNKCIGYPESSFLSILDILDKTGGRGKVKLAFDEWNLRGWHHPGFPRKQVSETSDPAEVGGAARVGGGGGSRRRC